MIDWPTEWPVIKAMCARRQLDACFIAAVRATENGAPGREFGVLHVVGADTYDGQLRICTRTIAGYLMAFPGNPLTLEDYAGFKRLVYTAQFVQFTSERYAPVGVSNDPQNINVYWPRNCTLSYRKFLATGGPL